MCIRDSGDTFLFNGRMRPEAVLGVGVQKRIMRAGPLAVELEADLFSHIAKQQQGGEFNQSKPYADLPAQSFGEGVLGIGARVWVQPWLSFSVVEGISYNSNVSLYEKTFRENYTQLLNYLGFEVEAAVSSDLSLVGRIPTAPVRSAPMQGSLRAVMAICWACATAGGGIVPSRRAP